MANNDGCKRMLSNWTSNNGFALSCDLAIAVSVVKALAKSRHSPRH